jgi:hypothetical protein
MITNSVRPTVVFVDESPWECFFHLAAILRKAGIRTVHVSVGLPDSLGDRMMFDRHVSLPEPPMPEHLAKILSNEYITDVQPAESLALTTYAALNLLPESQRSDFWSGRTTFLDKWHVASELRCLGLRTPDALLVDVATPSDAVREFSLPIVVKRRISSSGYGVEVFHTLESLETFVATIEDPNEWFFERFIHGRSLVYASCVGQDGIDVVAIYEILERQNPLGSSSVVEIRHDASISETGRMLINAMKIRGLVCFDVIRDANGVDWFHDINPRVFGAISMCQLAGADFFGAYLRFLLGNGPVQPSQLDSDGMKSFVFPYGWRQVLQSGRYGFGWILLLQWAWRFERLLGPRYFVSLALRSLATSVQKHRSRLQIQGPSLPNDVDPHLQAA